MNDANKTELPAPGLPGGTVTFIFTDIEGSTELLKQLGEQYATVLADQRRILREIFSRWNGQEVDTQGDSFFVSFPRATEAVAAAVEIQQTLAEHTWPEHVEVRLRLGLHTGEPLVAEEGYVGIDVHRAARIGNAGHGGQVLLSETTSALVMDELPAGVSLQDLGQHRLKDVRRPERIRQLVIEGLPAEFPPLNSLEALLPSTPGEIPQHNLPSELTPFIGREEELVTISDLLKDPSCRLLTLVGVGGIGKTRLALQSAAASVDAYPDGVWLVEFAKLRDPELVPQHAAAVLGVSAQEVVEGRDVGDVLAAYLTEKKLLMVLDNCEHLIEASAELAVNLLRECPEVQLIATSRENLGISGEKSLSVPAMEVPPESVETRDLEDFESVRLFVDRARDGVPEFRTTSGNSASIVNICRHLDGIPLAIELAAARVKILAPDQIADRLQDRFKILTGGPRTALPRHQTLKAAMEWSYSLLSESEKTLLIQLSVFSGGWTLEDAEGLIQDDLGSTSEILDLLSNLVDKSLVTVERKGGLARYGMLETIREFATDKLSASGDADDFSQRHANLFIELAEEAEPKIRSSDQLEWLELLRDEHENLRTALGWLIHSNRADEAARLVSALGWFWFIHGFWEEAWKWMNKILAMESDPSPHLRAKALFRTGGLEIIRGKLLGRVELVEEALDICTDIGDEEGMAWCLNLLGQAITYTKQDLDEGAALLKKSIELFRRLDDEWGVAWSTRYLGQIAEIHGDFDQSVQLQKEALHRFENLGDIWNTAHSLYLLGNTVRDHGDYDQARSVYQECFSKCKLVQDNYIAAHALQGLGMVAVETQEYRNADEHLQDALDVMQRIGDDFCASRVHTSMSRIAQQNGDYDQATKLLRQSLQGFKKLKRDDHIALSLARLATLAELSGIKRRSARLLGVAEAYRNLSQTVLAPVHRDEYDGLVSEFQKFRGDEVFERNYAEGYAMSFEDALAYALEENYEG
jgi:predicted ATPase/class 3 adenylate cyclase